VARLIPATRLNEMGSGWIGESRGRVQQREEGKGGFVVRVHLADLPGAVAGIGDGDIWVERGGEDEGEHKAVGVAELAQAHRVEGAQAVEQVEGGVLVGVNLHLRGCAHMKARGDRAQAENGGSGCETRQLNTRARRVTQAEHKVSAIVGLTSASIPPPLPPSPGPAARS